MHLARPSPRFKPSAAGALPKMPILPIALQVMEVQKGWAYARIEPLHSQEINMKTNASPSSREQPGIGLQIARELAATASPSWWARATSRAERRRPRRWRDARALQLDVTDRGSIAAAAERIRKELGRLDVLINNAAISNTSKEPGQVHPGVRKDDSPKQRVAR